MFKGKLSSAAQSAKIPFRQGAVSRSFTILILLALVTEEVWAKDRFEKWLEEVHWIISERELENFKQLSSEEEKQSFIEDFWARRDPAPQTSRNEYQEEYYRRFEYVNRHFREGSPGWRTDRGRVYLIHGRPDREESQSRPGGDAFGMRHQGTVIIWTYFTLSAGTGPHGHTVFVFQPDLGAERPAAPAPGRQEPDGTQLRGRPLVTRSGAKMGEVVDTSIRYRLVAAGSPEVLTALERQSGVPSSGLYARQIHELLRSPGDWLDEWEGEKQRQEQSRAALREQIQTRISFGTLPLEMACHDFYAPQASRVTVAWTWPFSEIAWEERDGSFSAKMDVMAQVRDLAGQLVDEFFKTLELKLSRREMEAFQKEPYRYLNEFRLPPGTYEITSLARDVTSGKMGSASAAVTCLDPPPDRITLSAIVLSRSVIPPTNREMGRDLMMEQWQIFPAPALQFRGDDKLVILFKIYNAQPRDNQPAVVVNYDFLQNNRIVRTSGARRLDRYTDESQKTISYSAVVDLSDFEAGAYRLQVTAIDYHTKNYTIRRTSLAVQ